MTKPEYRPYDNEDRLQSLYWDAGMTQKQIADLFGVSRAAIYRAMIKHDIETRGRCSKADYNKYARFYTHKEQGYEHWKVSDSGTSKSVYIHQLVAIADGADPYKIFGGDEYVVHHKKRIPWLNYEDNLEVMKRSDHTKQHIEQGHIDLEKCGPDRRYTDEQMLEWIDAFVNEFGVVPAQADINGWPGPSSLIYRKRFGSWKEAIREAGYTPRSE